jgi:hypothetical protein
MVAVIVVLLPFFVVFLRLFLPLLLFLLVLRFLIVAI